MIICCILGILIGRYWIKSKVMKYCNQKINNLEDMRNKYLKKKSDCERILTGLPTDDKQFTYYTNELNSCMDVLSQVSFELDNFNDVKKQVNFDF